MNKVTETIIDLKKKAKEAEKLEKMQKSFPDLIIHTDRWNNSVYASATVNPIVNQWQDKFNCGCCEDSPKEIWPYVETEYGRIYSNPPCICIGEKNNFSFSGINLYEDWKERFLNHNINQTIINKIHRAYENSLDRFAELIKQEIADLYNKELSDIKIEYYVKDVEKHCIKISIENDDCFMETIFSLNNISSKDRLFELTFRFFDELYKEDVV